MPISKKPEISRRGFNSALLGTALAGSTGAKSWAQGAYPSRAVRLMVPYPAAGAADLLARTFGQALSEQLGQPVVIENRGGANGTIGSNVVAKAAPDGYTLLLDNITFHAINASLYKTLPFNSLVRVTNPANGESVVVRINDRGPFSYGDRCLDLSASAFASIAARPA